MERNEFVQHAAIAAMQGMLSSGEGWCRDKYAKELARRAVLMADILFDAMNSPEEEAVRITWRRSLDVFDDKNDPRKADPDGDELFREK